MTTAHAAVEGIEGPRVAAGASTRWVWPGRIAGGIAVAFLLMDAVGKLLQPAPVVEGTLRLGYSATVLATLGMLQLACLALYLFPRTAVLGAVLWTGYLGGAVASHVRIADPLLTHALFPVYVAVLLWGSLWLRDPRLRTLLPIERRTGHRL